MNNFLKAAAFSAGVAAGAGPAVAQDVKQGDLSKPAPFSMKLDPEGARGFNTTPPPPPGGTAPQPPAPPGGGMVMANPQQVFQLLQGEGYQVEMQQNQSGQYILGTNGNAKYGIFFIACQNGQNCLAMQFYTNYQGSVSLDQINTFNLNTSFGSAILEDGQPALEMELVTLQTGIPAPVFLQYADLFASLMGDMEKMVGFR